MLTTVKGVYKDGKIVLSETPPVTERTDVIVTFLTEEKIIAADDFDESTTSKPATHLASESILSKDWLTPEEDKAWQDL